jgi:hypothetical protein
MRLNEILTEDTEISEGPLMNKIGTAVGKAVGTAAKGVGAVAGGIAGLGAAAKKGYAAGKNTVAGAGDDEDPAAQGGAQAGGQGAAGGQQPASGGDVTKRQVAQDMWKKGKIGQNNPFLNMAKKAGMQDTDQETPAAGGGQAGGKQPAAGGKQPAAQGGAQAGGQGAAPADNAQQDQAPQGTAYSQVKSKISQLDKKGKQRILAALQKELGAQPAAQEKPAAGGAGAFGQMAANLQGEPNPAVSTGTSSTGGTTSKVGSTTTHTANPNNPNAQQAPAAEPNTFSHATDQGLGKQSDGQFIQPNQKFDTATGEPLATPAAEPTMQTKKRAPRKSRAKAPAQPSVQAASKVNTGNPLAEALEQKIEEHKRKLFTENIKTGATSIFKK